MHHIYDASHIPRVHCTINHFADRWEYARPRSVLYRKCFWEILLMSSYEAKSQAKQNNDNVLGLLRLFLDTHHLSLEELAGLLRITPQTLEEWFSEGMAPPASCLALAVLFDTRRQILGRMSNH
jgi:hypothetical protein